MKNIPKFTKEKGLSTIVGLIMFLILALTAFGAIVSAMQFQTELITTQRTIADESSAKAQEKFTIMPSYDSNNFLSVKVTNQGTNQIEIADMFIVDKINTNNPDPLTPSNSLHPLVSISYKDSFIPPGATVNILASQPWKINDGTYDIKVVTKLGTTQKIQLQKPCTGCLDVKFFATNKEIITGADVTLIMIITNKATTDLHNIKTTAPVITFTGTPPPTATFVNAFPTNPPTFGILRPGELVVFTWNYYPITGTGGSSVTFTTNVSADEVPLFPVSVQNKIR